ncbi:hypothetical protein ZWY2020_044461 [Hordeum vulgare]|nr:hypothetical protein ZWY2020_044461 [Hordeum vulgare]
MYRADNEDQEFNRRPSPPHRAASSLPIRSFLPRPSPRRPQPPSVPSPPNRKRRAASDAQMQAPADNPGEQAPGPVPATSFEQVAMTSPDRAVEPNHPGAGLRSEKEHVGGGALPEGGLRPTGENHQEHASNGIGTAPQGLLAVILDEQTNSADSKMQQHAEEQDRLHVVTQGHEMSSNDTSSGSDSDVQQKRVEGGVVVLVPRRDVEAGAVNSNGAAPHCIDLVRWLREDDEVVLRVVSRDSQRVHRHGELRLQGSFHCHWRAAGRPSVAPPLPQPFSISARPLAGRSRSDYAQVPNPPNQEQRAAADAQMQAAGDLGGPVPATNFEQVVMMTYPDRAVEPSHPGAAGLRMEKEHVGEQANPEGGLQPIGQINQENASNGIGTTVQGLLADMLHKQTNSADPAVQSAEGQDQLLGVTEGHDLSSNDTSSGSDSGSSSGSELDTELGKCFYPSIEALENSRPPEVGMKFPTLEDAERFYSTHALLTGFAARRGTNYKRKKFHLLCNRSGKLKPAQDLQRKRKVNVLGSQCQAKDCDYCFGVVDCNNVVCGCS